jgi:putative transposase
MRKTIFSIGEYYHIYNRGTDKRRIFLRDADYQRFFDGMRSFNTLEPTGHLIAGTSNEAKPHKEGALVNVVAYCLMPNHFHLLLQQVYKKGLPKYLHRLLTGYTMYFNKRYDRTGVLFQGAFKSKHINDDSYLLHLTRYIHLNPLEKYTAYYFDRNKINSFLIDYPWSSYSEYIKTKNTNLISGEEVVLEQFKNRKYYQDFVLDLASGKDEILTSRPSLDFSFEARPRKRGKREAEN